MILQYFKTNLRRKNNISKIGSFCRKLNPTYALQFCSFADNNIYSAIKINNMYIVGQQNLKKNTNKG